MYATVITQKANTTDINNTDGWALNQPGTLTWFSASSRMSFSNASALCTNKGAGWRLPTIGELSGFRNTSAATSAAIAAGWMTGGGVTGGTDVWSSTLDELWGSNDRYMFIFTRSLLYSGPALSDLAGSWNVWCVK